MNKSVSSQTQSRWQPLSLLLLAFIVGLSSGCELTASNGPSDTRIARDLSDETLRDTQGLFDVRAAVLRRNQAANDIVDIDVELTMVRTTAEVPPQIRARAVLRKGVEGDGSMLSALQLAPGQELPAEVKTFTYTHVGDAWQRNN